MEYSKLLDGFVEETRQIFRENLTGIYLHGSAVMGCFHPDKSDLDLLIVVENDIPDGEKRKFMGMVAAFNENAPAKGLELSILKREFCKPFAYPTPFELHFSAAHLDWFRSDPDGYVEKMKGTDKDLAAHVTILRHRGAALYGEAISEVFGEVGREAYFDSIWNDIAEAQEEILENPIYITLNLCRVLAFGREGAVLSKKEGGAWGLGHLPEAYHGLIAAAVEEYAGGAPMAVDAALAVDYAGYMLQEITACREQ